MTNIDFDFTNLNKVFRNNYFSTRKQQQILAYLLQIRAALSKFSSKKTIVFLDCCCGRSYLTFAIYQYCKLVLQRDIKIIGVDTNTALIAKCNQFAAELNFKDMYFYCSDINTFIPSEPIDIVCSLHACNAATDLTIAAGVKTAARYIFSVSCCQHTNISKLRSHPLVTISRHHVYKERLGDMISDSMRALLLEHFGYGVSIFEFVGAEHTPKNIMLRAIKNAAKKQDNVIAFGGYQQLAKMFNFTPELENLL